ncbi:hypothetical protein [uncultured Pontibacter sp.]|uniref:hypothetical protein n=1 Tax=uncultured Pontibacter sp. TaxID=453356 RepID=UPI00261A3B80|nr:hypothetical protein [uncultured Pontibacter sp.]
MKPYQTPHILLGLALALSGCQQDAEKETTGSLAETHPKLEQQLARDSVSEPVTDGRNPDLYQRYRITMEEYENSGNYEVGNMYRGLLSPLDENSHSEAKTNKSAINEGLKQGVNFAGKYTVVTVGCGTDCQMHYVVDRENGKVLDKLQGSKGATYTPTSRLFILNPPDSTINYNNCSNCTPEAYIFEEGKFKKAAQR